MWVKENLEEGEEDPVQYYLKKTGYEKHYQKMVMDIYRGTGYVYKDLETG